MNPANNTGPQTLKAIAKANRFNRWMYDTIRPYCHGSILEIGSGIGNISSFFVADNFHLTLSDVDKEYLHTLTHEFGGRSNVSEILSLDLDRHDFTTAHQDKQNTFDTIFILNVLEHIKDDDRAVQNCRYLLKKGGTLIILVPAYAWLYCNLDERLGHYRRYTLRQLTGIIYRNQLSIKKGFYFNAMGMIAWLYAKVFRLSVVPLTEMTIYDKMVPFAKIIDKTVFRSFGLSAIIIGEK